MVLFIQILFMACVCVCVRMPMLIAFPWGWSPLNASSPCFTSFECTILNRSATSSLSTTLVELITSVQCKHEKQTVFPVI